MGSLNIALNQLFDEWKSTYDSPFVAVEKSEYAVTSLKLNEMPKTN